LALGILLVGQCFECICVAVVHDYMRGFLDSFCGVVCMKL
jgi:hypothetical protein